MFVIEQKKVCGLAWACPGVLILACDAGRLAFYDVAARTECFSFRAGVLTYVAPVLAASGDGRWMVTHRALWDLTPTVAALTAGASPVPDPVRRCGESYDSPEGAFCALTPDGQRTFRYVDTERRYAPVQQLLGLPGLDVQTSRSLPEPCPWEPAALSDRCIAWFGRKWAPYKEVRVYSLEDGALLSTLPHTQGINAARFSRDGRLFATAAGVTVRVWDPTSGECVRRFKGQRGNVRAIAFHPSGRFLGVCCPDESVRFWDVQSGRELASYAWGFGPASHLTFSPDGTTAAAGAERGIVVWDVDA